MIKKIRHAFAAMIITLTLTTAIGIAVLLMSLVWLGVAQVWSMILF